MLTDGTACDKSPSLVKPRGVYCVSTAARQVTLLPVCMESSLDPSKVSPGWQGGNECDIIHSRW